MIRLNYESLFMYSFSGAIKNYFSIYSRMFESLLFMGFQIRSDAERPR